MQIWLFIVKYGNFETENRRVWNEKSSYNVRVTAWFTAERARFELAVHFWRTHAFQACLFNHSSISPQKIRLPYVVVKSKRRDRDSNPGNLAVQRFSRPPQSTTLPPLQYYKEKSFLQSRAKVQIIFKSTSSLLFFHDLIVLLQHDLPTKLWA